MIVGCDEEATEPLVITTGLHPVRFTGSYTTYNLDRPISGHICATHAELLLRQHPTLGGLTIDANRVQRTQPIIMAVSDGE